MRGRAVPRVQPIDASPDAKLVEQRCGFPSVLHDAKPRGRRGGPPGQQQGRDAVQRDDDALKQQVDRLIAENRFCRDGYFVLDQYSGAGGKSLRGECREGASPEDRIRFPNPV